MLRPAARRVALCNTGCSKLQGGVLHVAARRVASCNTTCCRLQRRVLQVVARIRAGCGLSGCRLQHRALQVATRRVARHHHVLQARCSTPPPSRTPPCVPRRGCCLQRRRRRPLRVRLPVPRSVAAAAWMCTPPLVCRAAPQSRLPRAAARVCGLRTGVQSTASASASTPSRAPPTAGRPRANWINRAKASSARCPTCSTG